MGKENILFGSGDFRLELSSSSYEELIYQKIKEAGDKGIPQRDLIKNLGLDARVANTVIKKLIEQKKIKKKSIKENGKNVIKLFPNEEERIVIYVKLENIVEVPCFTCKNLSKCGNGGITTPSSCSILSKYILTSVSAG
ncbi:hypothetical protein [Sulfolobus acidocaldarius]|uniref:Conserved Crenarchaeal protein n=1 Tax=Sulfolobus acidocaldarius (strain ATCC 33909 / DSM 639 / JCM 8929 / NBRC 15157 / NCIMB 11770) TaxID=330779 RepID=Q4J948_SULAC|nr:hypothetical protein [Sulfolobus acidocaldarius]AAY80677.1 conserved Crenarchaeal protein [Sulfolobus acidocaldarius DSM 639]